MNDPVLVVQDLRKSYGDFVAVDGISLEVRRGEIFGLLGPNGAGKTTTLECVEGIRRPDGGSINILGVDPSREARKLYNLIGVQLQTSGLPEAMTAGEAMAFFCSYHRVAPRYDLLKRLGLGDKLRTQYRALSTGQQRRLALALAVAHEPALLLLDEPTAGLDVESRTELHGMMKELQTGGTTIILATHDMAEAEKMADRVSILLRGKIVATGTPRELTATGNGLTKVSVRSEHSTLCHNGHVMPAQAGIPRPPVMPAQAGISAEVGISRPPVIPAEAGISAEVGISRPPVMTAQAGISAEVGISRPPVIPAEAGISVPTGIPAVSRRAQNEEYAIYYSTDPGPTVSAILEYLAAKDDRLIDLRVERPSLEERFLEITEAGGVS